MGTRKKTAVSTQASEKFWQSRLRKPIEIWSLAQPPLHGKKAWAQAGPPWSPNLSTTTSMECHRFPQAPSSPPVRLGQGQGARSGELASARSPQRACPGELAYSGELTLALVSLLRRARTGKLAAARSHRRARCSEIAPASSLRRDRSGELAPASSLG